MISARVPVGSRGLIATMLPLASLMVSCKNLTNVYAPDVVQSTSLDTPAGALVRAAGANGRFATGLAHASLASGLFADEFRSTGANSAVTLVDQRQIPSYQSVSFGYPYDYLSWSRIASLQAVRSLELYNPSQSAVLSQQFAILGFVNVLFAENMCSSVPLGDLDASGAPMYGPTASRSDLLRTALADFDSATSRAAGDTISVALAAIGRGRALVDAASWQAARQAVSNVAPSFAYSIPFSATLPNDLAQALINQQMSVANAKGSVGIDYVAAADNRVPLSAVGVDANADSIYVFTPYAVATGSIVLASGIEGRLIVAEAALPSNGGSGTEWLDTLNALRAAVGDSTLHDPGSDAARIDLLFRERALWLFGTDHRHGDLRRLAQLYGRSPSDVFPHGLYNGGPQSFGSTISFTPFGESANPHFAGCQTMTP